MKTKFLQFLILFTFCFISQNAFAQLPDGSDAPEWTATDINGQSHTMSDMINSGKHVVLEFSAIWCGSCWSFHNTGTLETLYELYGPNGTDQIRVFYIEADQTTNTDCLYDLPTCNGNSQGNWVAGTDFPFIDLTSSNASSMSQDYSVGYYPTIYAVSANTNGVYEVGQETNIDNWDSWFFESFEMQTSASVVDADCPGEGSIQMTTTNGAGSLDYIWDNGMVGDYIDGLFPGTYTVEITDDNGYSLLETVTVGGPTDGALEVATIDDSDILCFGESNGTITVEGIGGNGGYSYAWDNGSNAATITDLALGTYTVVITDALGCTSEETYVIEQPEPIFLTAVPEDANCGEPDGSVVAYASGGVGPWFYDYGVGGNYSGVFFGIEPGQYVMSVTDDNGCLEAQIFEIIATEGPEVQVDAEGSIDCSNIEITVSGSGSDEGDDIEYTWTTDDGEIVSGGDEIDAVVSAAGTYTLEVLNTETGCSETASVEVDANTDVPTAEVEDPAGLDCITTSTTLDGSGSSEGDDFTYAWTTDDGNITSGASTEMAEVDAAGTYTLLVTNTTNGCTSSKSVDVMLDDAVPSVMVEDAIIDCTTTEVELCAEVADDTEVIWTTPNGDVEGNCIMVSMAGMFVANAKGANGCEASAEAEVTLSADLPQVSIADPEVITCTVTSIELEATLDGDVTDFNIEWSNAAGDVINNSDLTVEVSDAGEYTLVVVNPENGCTTTSAVTVDEVIVNPEAGFVAELVDGVLILTSNSGGDPSAFMWNNGDDSENTEVTFDENGSYEICLTVTNDCGDDTYCEEVLYVTQLQFESVGLHAQCAGSNDGSITITPEGGLPEYTIAWTGPNGFTSDQLTIEDLEPGTYNMVLTDDHGYEKSGSFDIEEPSAIMEVQVEITDEINQDADGSILFDADGGTGSLSYLWSNGSTGANISDLSAGEYSVIVTDENGCMKEFGPYEVGSTIVGVIDLDIVKAIDLFPNPAFNSLTVNVEMNTTESTQMRIIDAYGKVITSETFNQKEVNKLIDVSLYPAGVYYIEFGNTKGRSLEKFIVLK